MKVTYLDCPEGDFTPIMELLLSIKSEDKKDVCSRVYAVRITRILGEICVRRMVEISARRHTMAVEDTKSRPI